MRIWYIKIGIVFVLHSTKTSSMMEECTDIFESIKVSQEESTDSKAVTKTQANNTVVQFKDRKDKQLLVLSVIARLQ
jgi:hypothetical protein